MMKVSPTQLTLEAFRARGYVADVTERRIPHANTTVDLFGMFDVLAIGGMRKPAIVGIQATDRSNFSKRIKKVHTADLLPLVLASGITVVVLGWRSKPKRIAPEAGAPAAWLFLAEAATFTVGDFGRGVKVDLATWSVIRPIPARKPPSRTHRAKSRPRKA